MNPAIATGSVTTATTPVTANQPKMEQPKIELASASFVQPIQPSQPTQTQAAQSAKKRPAIMPPSDPSEDTICDGCA